jgi:hypothetical protein
MKLKKGSKEAKAFMAKLRAARKGAGAGIKYKKPKLLGLQKLQTKKTIKRKLSGKQHTDNKSHNYRISISGFKLSEDEKKFLVSEGKRSKGFKYRAKILWGDFIVLKEKENGTPISKFIVDNMEVAKYLSEQLNKGTTLTKVKTKKI